MHSAWTLPLIEMELELLPADCDFMLDSDDAARLFGADEDAGARMDFLATGHGCAVRPGNDRVTFRKLADRRAAPADGLLPPVECFPACGSTPRLLDDDHPGQDCP